MLDAELVGVTQSVPKYQCSGSGQWSKQSHQQQLPSVKYSPLKVLFIASSNRVHTHHHLCSIWTNKNVASLSLSTLLFPLFPELQTGDRTESVEVRLGVPWRYGRSRSWGPRPSSTGPSQSVRCPGAGHPHQPPTSSPQLLSFSSISGPGLKIFFPLAVYWI